MKKLLSAVALFGLLLGLYLVYVLTSEPVPNQHEKKLIESIQTHLKNPGDWAKLSDIHPGNWTEVCFIPSMSTSGAGSEKRARTIFSIKTEKVNFPNGIPNASDWNSVAMFFYPPNTVEGFEVPSNVFLGFGAHHIEGRGPCPRSKDEAVLVLQDIQKNNHGKSLKNINLMTPAQLKQMESKDAR
ncbi:hypothetical protein [Pseudomonas sp. Irchel 3A7]|uniref:hypothetical protein n=1 Tax=Pseudomonas sp. Irchel 3A7 TaxID=2008913 RepID=UPI0011401CFE|nr:hypothetical protein [Pseudomonas sp. Irchel 3A7]